MYLSVIKTEDVRIHFVYILPPAGLIHFRFFFVALNDAESERCGCTHAHHVRSLIKQSPLLFFGERLVVSSDILVSSGDDSLLDRGLSSPIG